MFPFNIEMKKKTGIYSYQTFINHLTPDSSVESLSFHLSLSFSKRGKVKFIHVENKKLSKREKRVSNGKFQ